MMDYGNMFSRLQQFGQNRQQMGQGMQGWGQGMGQHPMMQRFQGMMGGMGQGGMPQGGSGPIMAPQQQPQQGMQRPMMGGLFNRLRG